MNEILFLRIKKNVIDFPPDFTLRKHHQLSFLSVVLNKMLTDNKIPCYFNFICDINFMEIMSKIVQEE